MAGLHTLHAVSPQPQTLSEKHLDFLSLLGKVTSQSKTHCKSGLCLGTNKTLPPPIIHGAKNHEEARVFSVCAHF